MPEMVPAPPLVCTNRPQRAGRSRILAMANTKDMTREQRKMAKRNQRLELKKIWAGLNKAQRKELAEEKMGLRAYQARPKES